MDSIFGDYRYEIRVTDQRSLDGYSPTGDITSGVFYIVMDAGTKTASTIYKDGRRTALTNPVSRTQFATDGKVVFYGPNTSYDIYLAHSDGSVAFYQSVTISTHVLAIDRTGVDKCLVVPFGASDNAETDTGIDLPVGAYVTDCRLYVRTTDATETISVGLLSSETAGDADGLLAGVSVATAGWPALVTYTAGSNETYLATNLYGALIASGSVGNDVATDVGSLAMKGHVVTGANAKSVTYTGSAGSDTAAGEIYVFFKQLPQ
jgi:hypothetical protein